jgi:hypothetical protein
MKRSLAVTAVLLSLSLLGCGGPVSEPTMEPEAVSEGGESSTVSQFASCTGLSACSTLVGKRCFNEGEAQPCCAGTDVSEVYCRYSDGRLTFQY